MKQTLHIYKRVSSAVQTEGSSLKTQEDIGISLAKQLGMDYEVHDEGGKSSANDDLHNRPVMMNLLRLMDKGVVKHIYVYNTDRLSRNQITWYTIRQKMVTNKVTLYTPKGIHKTEDSMENMILGILSEVSQYDNKIRAERSRLGKFEKVKLNYWRGGDCPFGYKLKSDGVGNKLIENPDESKWVKFIFSEYIKGVSVKCIKQILEVNKIITRRGNEKWALGTLQTILRNELYTGLEVFYDKKSRQTITNKIPQLISNKSFEAAKERRNKILERKRQINRTKNFYLLRDFLYCGSCGTPMGGRLKHEQREQFYYCPLSERKFNNTKLEGVKCSMKRSLNIPSADKEIWSVIIKILTDTVKLREALTSNFILSDGLSSRQLNDHKKNSIKQMKLLETKKTQIEKALVTVESKNALGEYESKEVYMGVKRSLAKDYRDAKIKMENIQGQLNHLNKKEDWMEWIDDFGRQLKLNENMNDTEKKTLLSRILKDIIITYDSKEKLHHLRINFKLPILTDIKEISNKNAEILDLKSSTKKKTKMAESFTRKGDQNAPNGDYSTVTDLARFLGWSTLQPRIMAMW